MSAPATTEPIAPATALKQLFRGTAKIDPLGLSKPTAPVSPRLLTVKQAAAYSGATIWAIRQLYWAKEVAGTIVGRRLLISRESLDAFIDRRLAERGGVQ